MNYQEVISSQYLAALEMLKQAISRCPESIWSDPADKTKFWHIAYHALFFTHLYLHETGQSFVPWSRHRDEYEFLGQLPWPPHSPPRIGEPYEKEDLLEFLAFCQQQVADRVSHLDLDASSGFDWLPCSKFELQVYNIRHLQQHTGELMEKLGTRAGVDVDWIGMKHP